MNMDIIRNRLRQSFEMLANHSITYKKAILSDSNINAYEKVDSYEETTYNHVALNTANDRTVIYNTEYESKLYITFLVSNSFNVNKAYDRVILLGNEYKITDYNFLEQIPGLRKLKLEIEIMQ